MYTERKTSEMKVTVRAYAKINLTLDIVGKREDDYHLLESVMQSVSLHDTVTVSTDNSGEISVSTTNDTIADDKTNIAYRAAEAFFAHTGIENPGVDIRIKKRIPTGAGMAGGSADGAAVIIALNEIHSAGLSEEQLCDIGETVGADIPFCLTGGTMMVRGIGNILSPLPDLAECFIVVAKPEDSVSTGAAYKAVDEYTDRLVHPMTEDACGDICAEDIKTLSSRLCNVFEQALELPGSLAIRDSMLENGALGACMTGSGSAVFGLFEDEDDAKKCCDILKKTYDDVFLTEPVSRGCEIDQ